MENKKVETVEENVVDTNGTNTHVIERERIIEREVPVEVVKEIVTEVEVEKEVIKEIRPKMSFEGKMTIIKSLANFNKNLENISKTKDNPFTKSKYLDLATMLEVVRPLLAQEGLYIMQHKVSDPENERHFAIDTYIIHESGEILEIPGIFLKPDNNTIQGIAALESYERRYRIMCSLGIVGKDDDNDGEGAMDTTQTTPRQQATTPPAQDKPTTPATTGRVIRQR